ncbi:MAG TPA: type III secretion system export apparatus subunit SctT [Caulifigura sp.]|jgi:type III secretion protein T|nr:type III secretion system export apparatus subunit SctT [Caulifigura sp.]
MIDLDPARHFLIVFSLCMVRLTAACAVTPFLSTSLIDSRTRNSVLFSWGIIIYPIVAPSMDGAIPPVLDLIGLVAKEVVLGILFGFMASKVFWLAVSIGFFIDNQRGASMASVQDEATGESTSPFGLFLEQSLMVLFYSAGGLTLFLGGIFESYVLWPIGSFFPQFDPAFPTFVLGMADDLMKMVIVLSAPVIIAVFVSEFGLGLMNRFAPQLNVFVLAMPVKSLVAMIVLILYMPFLFVHLGKDFRMVSRLTSFFEGVLK